MCIKAMQTTRWQESVFDEKVKEQLMRKYQMHHQWRIFYSAKSDGKNIRHIFAQ